MSTTTALTIITAALQELGVIGAGKVPDPEDSATCFNALNVLADAWNIDPTYAYTSSVVSAWLPANTTSLTIGPGQSINCARPIRIEDPGSYVRVGNLDYPLEVVAFSEYNCIQLKTVAGPWPSYCFFDGNAPTGNVYFWPTGACTVNLLVLNQLSSFSTLTTSVTMTPGYERAFKFALMEEVAGVFGRPLTQLQMRNAASARRAIKRINYTNPTLQVENNKGQIPGWVRIRGGV